MMGRDDVLSSLSVVLLLFTALIDWTIYSWLILVAITAIVAGWYLRKG